MENPVDVLTSVCSLYFKARQDITKPRERTLMGLLKAHAL
jgi:hypothetical protein